MSSSLPAATRGCAVVSVLVAALPFLLHLGLTPLSAQLMVPGAAPPSWPARLTDRPDPELFAKLPPAPVNSSKRGRSTRFA